MNEKQTDTYRLPGVQDSDGNTGTLVFEVKPGGNVHAEFEQRQAPPAPTETPAGEPQPEQLPAQPEE